VFVGGWTIGEFVGGGGGGGSGYIRHLSRPALGVTQPPAQCVLGLLPMGKAAGGAIETPPPPKI